MRTVALAVVLTTVALLACTSSEQTVVDGGASDAAEAGGCQPSRSFGCGSGFPHEDDPCCENEGCGMEGPSECVRLLCCTNGTLQFCGIGNCPPDSSAPDVAVRDATNDGADDAASDASIDSVSDVTSD